MEMRGCLELADAIRSEDPGGHVGNNNSLELHLDLLLQGVLVEYT